MRRLEINTAKAIRFLAEQDGGAERELKKKLKLLFDFGGQVTRAYLAQVDLADGGETSVALCLRAQADDPDELVGAIATAFSGLFGSSQHLDIIFLRDKQEAELDPVCRPFFVVGGQ